MTRHILCTMDFLECGLMGYDTVYCGDNQWCGEIYSTALRIPWK